MQPSSRVQVSIPAEGRKLEGELIVPGDAAGVVAFAHGSGSSRHSPRNQFVARELQQAGLATLLLVGGNDEPVLQWNRDALECLSAEKELVVVARATHLFEEPGALEEVARQACRWFVGHLPPAGAGEKTRR